MVMRAKYIGETHCMEGPQVAVRDYDPRFRSFDSDNRLISCQEICAALRGEFGAGTFLIVRWA
jgi:hypothetical protein